MSEIWITSDWHFGHNKEFVWKSRGFSSVDEHDEAIIQYHNSLVAPDDTVYFLGDISLNGDDHGISCVHSLNGHILWIAGNHDSSYRIDKFLESCNQLEFMGYADLISISRELELFCCHYPMLTDTQYEQQTYRRTVCLHGHTHQNTYYTDGNPNLFHVGVDSNNCKPLNLEEILQKIK